MDRFVLVVERYLRPSSVVIDGTTWATTKERKITEPLPTQEELGKAGTPLNKEELAKWMFKIAKHNYYNWGPKFFKYYAIKV